LLEWLTEQVGAGEDAAESAIAFVDAHLGPTIDFMNAHGLTHFDTHFETHDRRLNVSASLISVSRCRRTSR